MEPVQYTVEQYRQVYDEMIKHYREMERLIQEAGRASRIYDQISRNCSGSTH